MYYLGIVLIFIVCLLLILVVLVQNSKGGGLSSSFAGSNQIMGVRKTTDFLEKATWWLAGALLFLCVVSTAFIDHDKATTGTMMNEQIQEAQLPTEGQPNFPTAAPEATEEEGGSQE